MKCIVQYTKKALMLVAFTLMAVDLAYVSALSIHSLGRWLAYWPFLVALDVYAVIAGVFFVLLMLEIGIDEIFGQRPDSSI